ncbi:MAG: Xaa-Pro peptidase family protein [Methanothrix sp.]
MEYVLHPRSEIDTRIRRLQDRMGEMTGAILFESTDLGYFSGTAQEGLIYVPRDGLPTLMIKKSQARAGQESPLPVQPQRSLKTLKKDLDLPDGARIGLELDVLPYNNYARLAKALGEDVQFSDISENIKHIRSVKSDFEIRLIREAARILDAGISSVSDHLKVGMREIDLAVAVESTMRLMGHQGKVAFRRFNQAIPMGHLMAGPSAALPSFVSSPTGGKGMSLFFAQGPGFARIKHGESVLVDYAGCYNGYLADETRIFSLGKLPSKLEDAHHAALQIEEAIAGQLSPGKKSREIWNLCETEGTRMGYQDFLGGPQGSKAGFVGHGVGLQIDEYPVIGPVDHEIVENMIVAVEPKMIYPREGVVGIEDTFLVGAKGATRLTRLPQEIWRV